MSTHSLIFLLSYFILTVCQIESGRDRIPSKEIVQSPDILIEPSYSAKHDLFRLKSDYSLAIMFALDSNVTNCDYDEGHLASVGLALTFSLMGEMYQTINYPNIVIQRHTCTNFTDEEILANHVNGSWICFQTDGNSVVYQRVFLGASFDLNIKISPILKTESPNSFKQIKPEFWLGLKSACDRPPEKEINRNPLFFLSAILIIGLLVCYYTLNKT